MKCQKCGREFEDCWESKKTYEGIDYHHNPPISFSKFLNEKWKGKIIPLCRKCHKDLHSEIIKILNKKAETLKFIKSEYWVFQRMNLLKIKETQKEIYDFTIKWLNQKENDSKTIS